MTEKQQEVEDTMDLLYGDMGSERSAQQTDSNEMEVTEGTGDEDEELNQTFDLYGDLPSDIIQPESSFTEPYTDKESLRETTLDDLDLYDDILTEEDVQEKQSYEEKTKQYELARKLIEKLESENKKLQEELLKQTTVSKNVQKNMSSLLVTARGEIIRKDREIERLRKRNSLPLKDLRNSDHQSCVNKGIRDRKRQIITAHGNEYTSSLSTSETRNESDYSEKSDKYIARNRKGNSDSSISNKRERNSDSSKSISENVRRIDNKYEKEQNRHSGSERREKYRELQSTGSETERYESRHSAIEKTNDKQRKERGVGSENDKRDIKLISKEQRNEKKNEKNYQSDKEKHESRSTVKEMRHESEKRKGNRYDSETEQLERQIIKESRLESVKNKKRFDSGNEQSENRKTVKERKHEREKKKNDRFDSDRMDKLSEAKTDTVNDIHTVRTVEREKDRDSRFSRENERDRLKSSHDNFIANNMKNDRQTNKTDRSVSDIVDYRDNTKMVKVISLKKGGAKDLKDFPNDRDGHKQLKSIVAKDTKSGGKVLDLREKLKQKRTSSPKKPISEIVERKAVSDTQISIDNQSKILNHKQEQGNSKEEIKNRNVSLVAKINITESDTAEMRKDREFLESLKSFVKDKEAKTVNQVTNNVDKMIENQTSIHQNSIERGRSDMRTVRGTIDYDDVISHSNSPVENLSFEDEVVQVTSKGNDKNDPEVSNTINNKSNVEYELELPGASEDRPKNSSTLSPSVHDNFQCSVDCSVKPALSRSTIEPVNIVNVQTDSDQRQISPVKELNSSQKSNTEKKFCNTGKKEIAKSTSEENLLEASMYSTQKQKDQLISAKLNRSAPESISDETFNYKETGDLAKKVERRRSLEKKRRYSYRGVTSETISSVTSSEESPSVEEFLQNLRKQCGTTDEQSSEIKSCVEQNNLDTNKKSEPIVLEELQHSKNRDSNETQDSQLKDSRVKKFCSKEGCSIKVNHLHPKSDLSKTDHDQSLERWQDHSNTQTEEKEAKQNYYSVEKEESSKTDSCDIQLNANNADVEDPESLSEDESSDSEDESSYTGSGSSSSCSSSDSSGDESSSENESDVTDNETNKANTTNTPGLVCQKLGTDEKMNTGIDNVQPSVAAKIEHQSKTGISPHFEEISKAKRNECNLETNQVESLFSGETKDVLDEKNVNKYDMSQPVLKHDQETTSKYTGLKQKDDGNSGLFKPGVTKASDSLQRYNTDNITVSKSGEEDTNVSNNLLTQSNKVSSDDSLVLQSKSFLLHSLLCGIASVVNKKKMDEQYVTETLDDHQEKVSETEYLNKKSKTTNKVSPNHYLERFVDTKGIPESLNNENQNDQTNLIDKGINTAQEKSSLAVTDSKNDSVTEIIEKESKRFENKSCSTVSEPRDEKEVPNVPASDSLVNHGKSREPYVDNKNKDMSPVCEKDETKANCATDTVTIEKSIFGSTLSLSSDESGSSGTSSSGSESDSDSSSGSDSESYSSSCSSCISRTDDSVTREKHFTKSLRSTPPPTGNDNCKEARNFIPDEKIVSTLLGSNPSKSVVSLSTSCTLKEVTENQNNETALNINFTRNPQEVKPSKSAPSLNVADSANIICEKYPDKNSVQKTCNMSDGSKSQNNTSNCMTGSSDHVKEKLGSIISIVDVDLLANKEKDMSVNSSSNPYMIQDELPKFVSETPDPKNVASKKKKRLKSEVPFVQSCPVVTLSKDKVVLTNKSIPKVSEQDNELNKRECTLASGKAKRSNKETHTGKAEKDVGKKNQNMSNEQMGHSDLRNKNKYSKDVSEQKSLKKDSKVNIKLVKKSRKGQDMKENEDETNIKPSNVCLSKGTASKVDPKKSAKFGSESVQVNQTDRSPEESLSKFASCMEKEKVLTPRCKIKKDKVSANKSSTLSLCPSERVKSPSKMSKTIMSADRMLRKSRNQPKCPVVPSKSDKSVSGSILRLVSKSNENIKEKYEIQEKSKLGSPKKKLTRTPSRELTSDKQSTSSSAYKKKTKLTFKHEALPDHRDPAKELTESLAKITAYNDRVQECRKSVNGLNNSKKKNVKSPPFKQMKRKPCISSDTEDYDVDEIKQNLQDVANKGTKSKRKKYSPSLEKKKQVISSDTDDNETDLVKNGINVKQKSSGFDNGNVKQMSAKLTKKKQIISSDTEDYEIDRVKNEQKVISSKHSNKSEVSSETKNKKSELLAGKRNKSQTCQEINESENTNEPQSFENILERYEKHLVNSNKILKVKQRNASSGNREVKSGVKTVSKISPKSPLNSQSSVKGKETTEMKQSNDGNLVIGKVRSMTTFQCRNSETKSNQRESKDDGKFSQVDKLDSECKDFTEHSLVNEMGNEESSVIKTDKCKEAVIDASTSSSESGSSESEEGACEVESEDSDKIVKAIFGSSDSSGGNRKKDTNSGEQKKSSQDEIENIDESEQSELIMNLEERLIKLYSSSRKTSEKPVQTQIGEDSEQNVTSVRGSSGSNDGIRSDNVLKSLSPEENKKKGNTNSIEETVTQKKEENKNSEGCRNKSVTSFILEDTEVFDVIDYEDDLSLGLDDGDFVELESEKEDSRAVDGVGVSKITNTGHESHEDGEVSSENEDEHNLASKESSDRDKVEKTSNKQLSDKNKLLHTLKKPFSPIKFPSPAYSPKTDEVHNYESSGKFREGKDLRRKRYRSESDSCSDGIVYSPLRKTKRDRLRKHRSKYIPDYSDNKSPRSSPNIRRQRSRSPKVSRPKRSRSPKGHYSRRSCSASPRRRRQSERSTSVSRSDFRSKVRRSRSGSREKSRERYSQYRNRSNSEKITRELTSNESSSEDERNEGRYRGSVRFSAQRHHNKRHRSDSVSSCYDSPRDNSKLSKRESKHKKQSSKKEGRASYDKHTNNHRYEVVSKKKGPRDEESAQEGSIGTHKEHNKSSHLQTVKHRSSHKRRYMSSSDDDYVLVSKAELKRRRSDRATSPQFSDSVSSNEERDTFQKETGQRKTSSEKENVMSPLIRKREIYSRKTNKPRML